MGKSVFLRQIKAELERQPDTDAGLSAAPSSRAACADSLAGSGSLFAPVVVYHRDEEPSLCCCADSLAGSGSLVAPVVVYHRDEEPNLCCLALLMAREKVDRTGQRCQSALKSFGKQKASTFFIRIKPCSIIISPHHTLIRMSHSWKEHRSTAQLYIAPGLHSSNPTTSSNSMGRGNS